MGALRGDMSHTPSLAGLWAPSPCSEPIDLRLADKSLTDSPPNPDHPLDLSMSHRPRTAPSAPYTPYSRQGYHGNAWTQCSSHGDGAYPGYDSAAYQPFESAMATYHGYSSQLSGTTLGAPSGDRSWHYRTSGTYTPPVGHVTTAPSVGQRRFHPKFAHKSREYSASYSPYPLGGEYSVSAWVDRQRSKSAAVATESSSTGSIRQTVSPSDVPRSHHSVTRNVAATSGGHIIFPTPGAGRGETLDGSTPGGATGSINTTDLLMTSSGSRQNLNVFANRADASSPQAAKSSTKSTFDPATFISSSTHFAGGVIVKEAPKKPTQGATRPIHIPQHLLSPMVKLEKMDDQPASLCNTDLGQAGYSTTTTCSTANKGYCQDKYATGVDTKSISHVISRIRSSGHPTKAGDTQDTDTAEFCGDKNDKKDTPTLSRDRDRKSSTEDRPTSDKRPVTDTQLTSGGCPRTTTEDSPNSRTSKSPGAMETEDTFDLSKVKIEKDAT